MNDETDYAPFRGDGRAVCACTFPIPGCANDTIRRSTARQLIDLFVESDRSVHSGQGATLWVILLWCQRHKIAYVLHAHPNIGYMVQRVRETIP